MGKPLSLPSSSRAGFFPQEMGMGKEKGMDRPIFQLMVGVDFNNN